MTRRPRPLVYAAIGVALLVAYAVVSSVLWADRGWDEEGPLSRYAPLLREPLPGAVDLDEALEIAFGEPSDGYRYKVVGGIVAGEPYYGVYMIDRAEGTVWWAEVIDADGDIVSDSGLIKEGGAWRWIGRVKTPGELVLGGAFVATIILYGWLYYRRPRPGRDWDDRSWWTRDRVLIMLAAIPALGWLVLARLRGVTTARKVRAVMQAGFAWIGFLLWSVWVDESTELDALSVFVIGAVSGALVWSVLGGRLLVAPAGFGLPEDVAAAGSPSPGRSRRRRPEARTRPEARPPAVPSASVPVQPLPTESLPFRVERPETLPTFADVGGMAGLKTELKQTIGLMLAFEKEAAAYRITWNGVLLHGPPGVGKTFVARAVAGEFGLNLIQVSAGELVSAYRGESSRNVDDAFRFAATRIPCLLFFDEFDAIAQNRQDWPDAEARRTVGQLLQALEEYRRLNELIVMAATNHLEDLDPAAIRPGRFDRHVRVDLPDAPARAAIFAACLKDRPAADGLDFDELARLSAGLTPAAIAQTVEMAALDCFRRAAASGEAVRLSQTRLKEALGSRGGTDRPMIENWTWDSLVLPEDTKAELQELQYVLEDPEAARTLGVEPPTGVLLTGPPGTGKTTVAKVLAAQARCSFYPVSAADLTSMWLGESERNIARLFERARENRPSIIFIDEIDAIASRRGEWGSYDRQINELLQEMDGISGQQGVFVLGATNRPDQLDPAVLRGGRLSRSIEIPLPDLAGRQALLRLFTKKMPLVGVRIDDIAASTEGASGADLRALCQQAALNALVRARREKVKTPTVTAGDFEEALAERMESAVANAGERS